MSETASDDSQDTILAIDDIPALLAPLNEARLKRIVAAECYVGTADGPSSEAPVTSIRNSKVRVGEDQAYYLYRDGKLLEISFILSPRSTCAFNNGPDGNVVFPSYLNSDEVPKGIQLMPGPKDSFVKTTEFKGIQWAVNIFDNAFKPGRERSFEWSTSGTPVNEDSRQYAMDVFHAVNKRFQDEVKTLKRGLEFKDNANGPTSSMFVFAKRPVLVPNSAPMDEGRGSEYTDPFNILPKLQNKDFKFNRIPETLVIDHANKTSKAMSFHHLHLLGSAIVMKVVVVPRAYEHNKKLGWDFRLVCVKVLGKKTDNLAVSPSKLVQKRPQVFLDLDSDEESDESHRDKRPRP